MLGKGVLPDIVGQPLEDIGLRLDRQDPGARPRQRGGEQRVAARIGPDIDEDEVARQALGQQGPLLRIEILRREQQVLLGDIVTRIEPHPGAERFDVERLAPERLDADRPQREGDPLAEPAGGATARDLDDLRQGPVRRMAPEGRKIVRARLDHDRPVAPLAHRLTSCGDHHNPPSSAAGGRQGPERQDSLP